MLLGIGGIVVVAALVVVAVVVLVKAAGLPVGRGTATMTWTLPAPSAHPAPVTFSGTVDDRAVTGTATASRTEVKSSQTASSSLSAARWTGTFGGTSFDLREKVTLGQPPPGSVTNKFVGGFSLTIHVTGTFGSQAVNIKAAPDPLKAGPVSFTGTVGDLHVKGKVSQPKENGEIRSVTARFTVTKGQ